MKEEVLKSNDIEQKVEHLRKLKKVALGLDETEENIQAKAGGQGHLISDPR